LTSPSRMTISDEEKSSSVVSILSALSALADSVPEVFSSRDRGRKAIQFALETILMGRGHPGSANSDEDSGASDEDADEGTRSLARSQAKPRRISTSRRKPGQKRSAGEASPSLIEDENLSVPCRRICAAIELVVTYIRSSLLSSQNPPSLAPAAASDLAEQTNKIFDLLTQIIRDQGLPPSNRDHRACKPRHDRAALRQCAAIHLLRLCDSRLGLEKRYLSLSAWHTLGEAFLDEDFFVREAVMNEYCNFLQSGPVYGSKVSRPHVPALRFIAFMVLCSDGDHGMDNDAANGNAANVGKLVSSMKNAGLEGVGTLRMCCNAIRLQCRASGGGGEQMFEQLKTKTMPENAFPFACHLLAHRRETPHSGAISGEGGLGPMAVDDESQQRVLRKRLKLLLEPLVNTLGEGATNITFLLRMAEILGKKYCPVYVSPDLNKRKASLAGLSIGSDSSADTKPLADISLLEARLKTICVAAQEVLLTFVKKDENLTIYQVRAKSYRTMVSFFGAAECEYC